MLCKTIYCNDFKIIFIDRNSKLNTNIDCIVLDLDESMNIVIEKCKEYKKNNHLILGAMSMPTKSDILRAKEAGCLMVLTKSNFSANLVDIINKST